MICEYIGVPISQEKTVWPTTTIEFLGVILDGEKRLIRIPKDKKDRAVNMLLKMVTSRKATVHELESLAGYLNFLNKAIFPGRAFTRRMYAKFSNISQHRKLKKHHHINLDQEFKNDCKVWLTFLNDDNVMSVYRPFVDLAVIRNATELFFYTDASMSLRHGGFGAVFGKNWLAGQWGKTFLSEAKPSIEFLEMAALVIAVFTWIDSLANSRVVLFCDNTSVVKMLNSTSSSCDKCMKLIRLLTLKCLNFNTRIFGKHVRYESNEIADALSRGQWQ